MNTLEEIAEKITGCAPQDKVNVLAQEIYDLMDKNKINKIKKEDSSPYPGSKLIKRYNDLDIYSYPDNLISSIEEVNAKNIMVIG